MGRIAQLLMEHDFDGPGIAVIDLFAVAPTCHSRLGMPYLIQCQANPSFVIVNTKVCSPLNTSHVNANPDCPGY